MLNLKTHPAVEAWRHVSRDAGACMEVEVLKEEKGKSFVYRLRGAQNRPAVIAKHCEIEAAQAEQAMYRGALSRIPACAPAWLGSHRDAGDPMAWIFLEDAGGREYDEQNAADRDAAARALARMHVAARAIPDLARLPRREPDHYFGQLQRGREAILANIENDWLDSDDRRVLRLIVAQCDLAAARWADVERNADRLPSTFIHGDLQAKNILVRPGGEIRFLDWEYAGWGTPLVDLGFVDADVYDAELRRHSFGSGGTELRALARLGELFRWCAYVEWTSTLLQFSDCHHVVGDFLCYAGDFRRLTAECEARRAPWGASWPD